MAHLELTLTRLDAATIREARRGDLAAFARIYQTFADLVNNVAYRIVGNREDAEEITQEVFLLVYRKLDRFQFQSSLKTWIYRIAVNTALTRRKQRSVEAERRENYERSVADRVRLDRTDPTPAANDRVQALLDRLPPEQRACLILRSIEGLSYQEIAEALEVNLNTVRSRLKRARENLMAGQEEEHP
jgi:RNA polymerase sigma-70 factor, ECF subfamily